MLLRMIPARNTTMAKKIRFPRFAEVKPGGGDPGTILVGGTNVPNTA
jgi:hypothetical protein